MGCAEVFTTVAAYEFAYFAAPRSAQAFFMSLHFCSLGISSYIGSAYIFAFPTTKFILDFSVSIVIESYHSHNLDFTINCFI